MTKGEKGKIFAVMNDLQREFAKPDCQDEGITYKIEAVQKVMCSLGIYGVFLSSFFGTDESKEGE